MEHFFNMEWTKKNVEWNGTDVGLSFPVHTHLLMISIWEELSGIMN